MTGILAMILPGTIKVTLNGDTIHAIVVGPATATASFVIGNIRTATESPGGTYTWLSGGLPSNYEIFATLTIGSATGTYGSWLNLGGAQSWSLSRSGVGTSNSVVALQIRPVGGSVVASASVTFVAEVD